MWWRRRGCSKRRSWNSWRRKLQRYKIGYNLKICHLFILPSKVEKWRDEKLAEQASTPLSEMPKFTVSMINSKVFFSRQSIIAIQRFAHFLVLLTTLSRYSFMDVFFNRLEIWRVRFST